MKKRDRQPPTTATSILSDAALNLSNICRRTIAADSIQIHTPKQAAPPKPALPHTPTEVLALRESLRQKEKECADFSVRMSKLSQSHMEVERRLMAANRDLLILQADQVTPPTIKHPPHPNIPVNTQGKDALYWHQACRTLQRQYTDVKNELENKTDQFIRLNDSYRAALRRLEEVESQRDKETPPTAGRQHSSTGYESSAPSHA